jgi:hypothetical protein
VFCLWNREFKGLKTSELYHRGTENTEPCLGILSASVVRFQVIESLFLTIVAGI